MGTRLLQVDAFAEAPFEGNPAAVCLLDRPRDEEWMQAVAREMNLSETAFPVPDGEGYQLRWFTPLVEVALCGHATLATAHTLWEEGLVAPSEAIRFSTRSGLLVASRRDGLVELDFPAKPETPADPPPGLVEALGVEPLYVGRSQFDYLVLVQDEEAVRALRPDIDRLSRVDTRGVIVTAKASTPGLDFVSRFFAPAVGVPEDPVTGSAHCCLAPFWKLHTGQETFTAYQASPRGGIIRLRVGDGRVAIAGKAVTVLRGELLA